MTNNLKFQADITLPDDTPVQPGQALTKTWRVLNNGSTTWQNCVLGYLSGEKMGAAGTIPLKVTNAGSTTEVSATLTAPMTAGSYRGYWQAQDASGQHFGDKIWVQVKVVVPQPAAILLNAVIDIYQENRLTDIEALKSDGIKAIIHKATESNNFKDNQYQARRTLAKAHGILWGAYHFGRPGNPIEQADLFLGHAQPDGSTLVALDLEGGATNGMKLHEAEQFVTYLHGKLGRWPVVYTSQSYMNSIMGSVTTTTLSQCPLWIASYREGHPRMPAAWKNWTLWQYTDGSLGPEPHAAKGVSSCDRNYFNGTLNDLTAFWGK